MRTGKYLPEKQCLKTSNEGNIYVFNAVFLTKSKWDMFKMSIIEFS